jgi:mannose-6-phosphate isomerase-like protein (cupin superfamily)
MSQGDKPRDGDRADRNAPAGLITHKPWGYFVVVDEGPSYKVKRLEVAPGKRLSYQRHSSRSEHWVIVQGLALVTIDIVTKTLHPGDSTFVPMGAAHRIANIGTEPMIFIEVQRGDYLGEDDIVRLQDDFNRT